MAAINDVRIGVTHGTPSPAVEYSDAEKLKVAGEVEEDMELWHESFLFKVPANQKRENPDAFEPELFFFGPYQYYTALVAGGAAAPSLDGEHLKHQIAKALLEEGQLQEIAIKIESHYSEIRDMYLHMTSQQWEAILYNNSMSLSLVAERMALDAVSVVAAWHVLESALRVSFGQALFNRKLATFSIPTVEMLLKDALLLENQVPLNVLRYAFTSLKHSFCYETTFEGIIRNYGSTGNYFPDYKPQWPNRTRSSECLLGAIYDSLTPPPTSPINDEDRRVFDTINDSDYRSYLLTASHLARCGIRCRVRKDLRNRTGPAARRHAAGHRFSLIKYLTKKDKLVPQLVSAAFDDIMTSATAVRFNEKEKVIELPRISVGEDTLRFLHNLLAYEASCRGPKERFVVSYVDLMDRLIDTEEDVKILVKAGVIQNYMGSYAELATAWNKLCKSVILCSTANDYNTICQVDAIAKSRWRRWKAEFMETYWEKKPWLVISIVVAVVLLVSTVLQTVFTIKK